MARIRVAVTIDAPRADVWSHIADIEGHVVWMRDAESIRFKSLRRTGRGTMFECRTRVGPFRTIDVMEVTKWRPPRVLGVRHTGLVTGTGAFRLRSRGRQRTKVIWEERLRFPWRFGGPLGAAVASPVLRRLWRGNLEALKHHIEQT
ncbi:MAG: SRPBCC family protein [Acidimicrobiales bacterium]|nr:SRPBCC family protein [Acidimicrobiales bacterium]